METIHRLFMGFFWGKMCSKGKLHFQQETCFLTKSRLMTGFGLVSSAGALNCHLNFRMPAQNVKYSCCANCQTNVIKGKRLASWHISMSHVSSMFRVHESNTRKAFLCFLPRFFSTVVLINVLSFTPSRHPLNLNRANCRDRCVLLLVVSACIGAGKRRIAICVPKTRSDQIG